MEHLSSKTGSPFCTSSRRCFEYSQALSQRAHRIATSRPRPPIFDKNTKKERFLDVKMEKLFHVERYNFYSVSRGTEYSFPQSLKEENLFLVEHLLSSVRGPFTQIATDVLLIESLFLMGMTDTPNKTLPSYLNQNTKKESFRTSTQENCSTWKNNSQFS